MNIYDAFAQQQTAGFPNANYPQAHSSHEKANRSQSNYGNNFYGKTLKMEILDMLIAAEKAIERSLSAGATVGGLKKVQQHVLNLLYYITHNANYELEALAWLVEYARSSVGLTLDSFYQEEPLKMPLSLLVYAMHQTAIPPKYRTVTLPCRHMDVSDTSSCPSSNADTEVLDCSLSAHGSQSSKKSAPGTASSTFQGPTQKDATVPLQRNYLPPFMSLLILTIQRFLKNNPKGHFLIDDDCQITEEFLWERLSSPPFFDGTEPCVIDPKVKSMPARSLFKEPAANDWKYLENWVNFLKGADLFLPDDLAWLLLRIVETQESLT